MEGITDLVLGIPLLKSDALPTKPALSGAKEEDKKSKKTELRALKITRQHQPRTFTKHLKY